MVELLVAGVITAFVLGAVSMCLSQLTSAKTTSRMNLEAHLRADAALAALRRDIVSVLRDQDLFHTRLLLYDNATRTPLGPVDRDEILVFNTRLRPIRDLDFMGDGMEFETQFRIEEDALGPALWQRRDAVPDEYPQGGGTVTPLVSGLVSLSVEAYDGDQWYPDWDSDFDGLPLAVRVMVIASGYRNGQDVYDAPLAALRTVIPIDRVLPPPQEEPDLAAEGDLPDGTEGIDGTGDGTDPADGAGGAGGAGGPGTVGQGGLGGRGGPGNRGGGGDPGNRRRRQGPVRGGSVPSTGDRAPGGGP
jgi:hypothetical protein